MRRSLKAYCGELVGEVPEQRLDALDKIVSGRLELDMSSGHHNDLCFELGWVAPNATSEVLKVN